MNDLKNLLEKLKEAEKVHMADCETLPQESIIHWSTAGKVDAFRQVMLAIQQTLLDKIGKPKTLKELYLSKGRAYYNTDKQSHHDYLQTYSELFAKFEKEPITLLEVGCYKNGSLKLWEEFFVNATIIGYDVMAYEGAVELNRATVILEDFYSSTRELPPLTIAIDDGDHSIQSQLAFIRKVYPYMAPGGILIVEDVMPGFKEHFDSLEIPYTAIAFYPPTDQIDDRIIVIRK